MTPQQFIEWLDHEIEDNDRRMNDSDGEMSCYYLGCATGMSRAKDRFLQVEFDPQNIEPKEFTNGLE